MIIFICALIISYNLTVVILVVTGNKQSSLVTAGTGHYYFGIWRLKTGRWFTFPTNKHISPQWKGSSSPWPIKYIYTYIYFWINFLCSSRRKAFHFFFLSVLTGFPAEKNMSHSSWKHEHFCLLMLERKKILSQRVLVPACRWQLWQ